MTYVDFFLLNPTSTDQIIQLAISLLPGHPYNSISASVFLPSFSAPSP